VAHSGSVIPALSISQAQAKMICKGQWQYNMERGTSNCNWCEKTPEGTDQCHFIACDREGCDYIISKRNPKRPLTFLRSAVDLLRY
jgi:hypothetical protein